MADAGAFNPGIMTDPRLMLAQQLMQGAGDASPVRSWTQELARALQGPVGAMMANKVRGEQIDAYSQLAGMPGQQQAPDQPGLLGRISNSIFGGGSNTPPPSTPDQTTAPPQGSAAPSAGGSPMGSPSSAPPQAGSGPAATPSTPMVSPGALANQLSMAQRMIAIGQKNGNLTLMQQGFGMLQALREKMAEGEISQQTDLVKQGLNYDPSTRTVTKIGGYDEGVGGTKQAEARGSALGGLDPAVTAGKVLQENTVNTGTMGSAAAKAGAIAGSESNARNASDLNFKPKIAAATTTAETPGLVDRASQIEQQQQQAKLDFSGKIADATTRATNQANAGKPLTPDQKVSLQQTASHEFTELPQVKEHYETAKSYANVQKAAQATGSDQKASDINLVDSIGKMFNPGGVLRQSTYNIIASEVQGLPSNVLGEIKGLYGNGAHLSPEARQALLVQAEHRMDSSRQAYNQFANFAAQTATANGLDPTAVVPKFIDPLTAREELARRQAARQQSPTGAPQ